MGMVLDFAHSHVGIGNVGNESKTLLPQEIPGMV